jgi:hypothetical protein
MTAILALFAPYVTLPSVLAVYEPDFALIKHLHRGRHHRGRCGVRHQSEEGREDRRTDGLNARGGQSGHRSLTGRCFRMRPVRTTLVVEPEETSVRGPHPA